jgi:hypothetical protein
MSTAKQIAHSTMSNEQIAKLRSEYGNQVKALKDSLEAQHKIAIDAAHEKRTHEVMELKESMEEQNNILRREVSAKEDCLLQLGEMKVALTKCKSELDSKTAHVVEMQDQLKKMDTRLKDGERQFTTVIAEKDEMIRELEQQQIVHEQKIRNFGGVLVTIAGDVPISQEVQNAVVSDDQSKFHASLRRLQDEIKAFIANNHADVKERAERPLVKKVEEQLQETLRQKELSQALEARLKDSNIQNFKQLGEVEELKREIMALEEQLAESEERVQSAAVQIEQREAEDSLLGQLNSISSLNEIRSLAAQNQELVERHESTIQELRARHQRDLSKVKDENSDALQNLTRQHEENVAKLQTKLEKEQKKTKSLQQKLIEHANYADVQLDSSRIESEQSAMELERLKRQMEEMQERYKEDIEHIQRHYLSVGVSPTKTSIDPRTPMSNITVTDDSQHMMTMSLLASYNGGGGDSRTSS